MDIIFKICNCFDIRNEKNIINIVLAKLNFKPKYYNLNKKDNIIFIKCHNYYINVYKNHNKNSEYYKMNILRYKQPLIFSNNSYISICENYNQIKNKLNQNLYICIKYADIIINLENKNYNIIYTYFNIRKPSNDKYKLFENIIYNIDNPEYYFICEYDMNDININYCDFDNNIYDLNNIKIIFLNNKYMIYIDVIMPTIFTLSTDIDTKPLVSNQIKRIIINDYFI
jgi:hypothetical protein